MVFLQISSFAQKTPKPKEVLPFEISKYSASGGFRTSSKSVLLIYQSGRIDCQSSRYDPRGKKIESRKNKCFQISKEKITELTELAEKTDFLEAKDDYSFFAGGADYGKDFSITYFKADGEKNIRLTNPRQSENNIELPESVTSFIEKIAEIDETMEIEREIETKSEPKNN
jgi:hypothetical protein